MSISHPNYPRILNPSRQVHKAVAPLTLEHALRHDVESAAAAAEPAAIARIATINSVAALDAFLAGKRVFGTTCLSTNHSVFAARPGVGGGSVRRLFDYVIVDEASQLTLPVCLGPLRLLKPPPQVDQSQPEQQQVNGASQRRAQGGVFVLVGDHFQLPPLVRNTRARDKGRCACASAH